MRIYKYLHSCVLIEEAGQRLLIDPGEFSFIERTIKPEDIGAVDAILLTHKHLDHYYPEALRIILKAREAEIFGSSEIAEQAKLDGLKVKAVRDQETFAAAGFSVRAIPARHGDLPAIVPENTAYFINAKIFHPGDSLDIGPSQVAGCRVLFLPVLATWLRLIDALNFALKINPKIVIPIHDAIIKDFVADRIYNIYAKKLGEAGIEFRPLGPREFVEI